MAKFVFQNFLDVPLAQLHSMLKLLMPVPILGEPADIRSFAPADRTVIIIITTTTIVLTVITVLPPMKNLCKLPSTLSSTAAEINIETSQDGVMRWSC